MHIITIYLVFSMLMVMWVDVTRYTIPNWLVGSILVLYPLAVYLSPVAVDWQSALMGMAAVFAVGYFLFSRKWMGGGDVKLITVCSLWMGLQQMVSFIFLLSVIGGVFSVLLVAGRKLIQYIPRKQSGELPRILREGAPAPYGVAIAAGFLIMIGKGLVPILSH